MTSTVKKIFRRCAILASIAVVLSGCASSKIASITEILVITSTTSKVVSVTQVTPESVPKVTDTSLIPEVSDTDLAVENTHLETKSLVSNISSRFNVSASHAANMVALASKYAFDDFPKKKDILAIIAVESSYKINALLHGCYGLMQIQKKSHVSKLKGRSLYDPSVNIQIGSFILHEYYLLLNKDKRAAILAYNAGIGNYLKHRYNSVYYSKYKTQLAMLNVEQVSTN